MTTIQSAPFARRGADGLAQIGPSRFDVAGIRFMADNEGAAGGDAAAPAAAGDSAGTKPPWGDDPSEFDPVKAWKLIEDAGLRGHRLGGAQMSEKHPNFLLNADGATAAELEALGELVRERVQAASGHLLQWEVIRIGDPA